MNQTSSAVVCAVILLGACKPPPKLCDRAAANLAKLLETSRAEGATDGVAVGTVINKLVTPLLGHQASPWRGIAERHCVADHWPAEITTCIVDSTTVQAAEQCVNRMSETLIDQVASDPAASGADPVFMPPACNDFTAIISKLAACEKLPPETRDAILEDWRVMSETWQSAPPTTRSSVATVCHAAIDAVNAKAKAICGWQ